MKIGPEHKRILENQVAIMDALTSILITLRLDTVTVQTRCMAIDRERNQTLLMLKRDIESRANLSKDQAM